MSASLTTCFYKMLQGFFINFTAQNKLRNTDSFNLSGPRTLGYVYFCSTERVAYNVFDNTLYKHKSMFIVKCIKNQVGCLEPKIFNIVPHTTVE